jgi:hypothetical protein
MKNFRKGGKMEKLTVDDIKSLSNQLVDTMRETAEWFDYYFSELSEFDQTEFLEGLDETICEYLEVDFEEGEPTDEELEEISYEELSEEEEEI